MLGYQKPTSYLGAVLSGPKKTVGACFPPFEFPNANTTYPEIPPEWRSLDPFLLGALPIPPTSLPGPGEAVKGKENAKKNAEKYMFKFGLENKRGECFRNAGLTCLLHNPIFYNFLMGHREDLPCPNDGKDDKDCLTCMFQDLARHYYPAVGDDRAILYGKVDDFFQQCRKEFWGPRSNLKKDRPEMKVGPDGDAGGNVAQYITWLIHYLTKQTHVVPRNQIDEHQFLKRMFWITFTAHQTCKNRHRKFLWRKARNWVQMRSSHPIPASLTVEDGLNDWLTDLAGPTTSACDARGCKSPSCTPNVKIENAPEILLIRTPFRQHTPHDTDFFFRVPFAKTVDLSAYSATGEDLKYTIQSMSLQLGYGFRMPGHVISIVQAADGNCYKIDNSVIQRVVSPGPFVDRAQSEFVDRDERLLPYFLVYVRVREADARPAVRSSKKRSSDEGEEVVPRRKAVKRFRN